MPPNDTNQTVARPAAEAPVRDVTGQVAVVTGAGAGIGRATAVALARAGARVVVADLDAANGEETARAIASGGGTALAVATDVSSADSVDALAERTLGAFERADLLVHSAGVAAVDPFPTTALDSWRRTFAVNVDGSLLLLQRFGTIMDEQQPLPATNCRGKIVVLSSAAAERPAVMMPAYGASKAALNQLAKTAAAVFGERQIPVTVLYPGNVADGMWSQLPASLGSAQERPPEEIVRERLAITPTGRFQTAEETAALVVFVASLPGCSLNAVVLWGEAHTVPL